MLTLGDGRRDMGKARANRNTSAKSVVSTPTSHAHVNKARKNKISRVRGRLSVQVGRAETRDKLSLGPPQRHQSILTPYISDIDQDEDVWTPTPPPSSSSDGRSKPTSPPSPASPSPPDGQHGQHATPDTDTIDSTINSSRLQLLPAEKRYRAEDIPPGRRLIDGSSLGSFTNFADPGCLAGTCLEGAPARSSEISSQRSLSSWLTPATDLTVEVVPTKGRRKRAHPSKATSSTTSTTIGQSTNSTISSRTWLALDQGNRYGTVADSEGGDTGVGSLSAWLQPDGKDKPACGSINSIPAKSSVDCRDKGDGEGRKWMSERLGGLDPHGAARARDSWADRDRRNLTSTDVALGAKRKSTGARGWKTNRDRGKVVVAPTRGGPAVVASGQAAFRMSMAGHKKRNG